MWKFGEFREIVVFGIIGVRETLTIRISLLSESEI